MNKKIQLSIGAIIIAGAFGTAYLINSNIEKRIINIQASMKKIQKELPKEIQIQRSPINKGFLSSTGSDKLIYTIDDKKISVSIDYKIEHGPASWFGGDLFISGSTKAEGNILNLLQMKTNDPTFSTFTGRIKEDSSFELNQKTSGFSLLISPSTLLAEKQTEKKEDGVEIKVNNGNSKISFTASTGELLYDFTYPKITFTLLPEKNLSATIADFNGIHKANINEHNTGSVSYKIGSITENSGILTAKGIEFNASVSKNKNRYNLINNVKIADLAVSTQKNSQIELGFSIKNLDNKIVDFYQEAYNSYTTKKTPTEDEIEKVKALLQDTIKAGITVSIDRIKLKNDDNLIDFNGFFEINENPKPEHIFLVSENAKVGFQLLAEGELAQAGYSMFSELISTENQNIQENKIFKAEFSYENGIAKINGNNLSAEVTEKIQASLRTIDSTLGFTLPAAPTTQALSPEEQVKQLTEKPTVTILPETPKDNEIKPIK